MGLGLEGSLHPLARLEQQSSELHIFILLLINGEVSLKGSLGREHPGGCARLCVCILEPQHRVLIMCAVFEANSFHSGRMGVKMCLLV